MPVDDAAAGLALGLSVASEAVEQSAGGRFLVRKDRRREGWAGEEGLNGCLPEARQAPVGAEAGKGSLGQVGCLRHVRSEDVGRVEDGPLPQHPFP